MNEILIKHNFVLCGGWLRESSDPKGVCQFHDVAVSTLQRH